MPGYLIGRLLGLPSYRDKTTAFVLTAQETLYKSILVLLTVTAILWMSIFLYATFYYTYVSKVDSRDCREQVSYKYQPYHTSAPFISSSRKFKGQRPKLQMTVSNNMNTRGGGIDMDKVIYSLDVFAYSICRSCGREKGLCTFPSANVTLTKRQKLLMVGQPYKIAVEIEMPESVANQQLGMFMICAELKNSGGGVIEKSCRSTILHYKSFFHHIIATFIYTPFLLSGSAEEKQLIPIELFSGFQEDPDHPATEAFIEIQTQHVEIYHTYLKIHAHFTGLRYFMFHWPVLSAILGISTNFFFLAIITFLSWYKFYTAKQIVVHVGYDANAARSLEERRALAKERLMRERGQLVSQEKIEDLNEALKIKAEIFNNLDEKSKMEVDPEEETSEKKLKAKELGLLDSSDGEKTKISGERSSNEFEIISESAGIPKDSDEEISEEDDEDKENDSTTIPLDSEDIEEFEETNVRLRKATSSKKSEAS